jgi:hypothetical protein
MAESSDTLSRQPGRPLDAPRHALGPAFEADLLSWLHDEVGFEEFRRVARVTSDEVQLSKFEPGFLKYLFDVMTYFPELFDEDAVVEAYAREATASAPDAPRVATWARASHGLLRAAGERHQIPDAPLHEIRVGIDSVQAILGAVLLDRPRVGDDFAPGARDLAKYREMLASLRHDQVFERFYGTFRGRAVRDYCPAMNYAYAMIAAGWRACTGTPAPRD